VLYALYDCVECVNCHVLSFGCKYVIVAGGTVAGSVNLAQVRETRPGDPCRSKLRAHETSPRWRTLVLSEAQSRSGESHSPKRGGVRAWDTVVV